FAAGYHSRGGASPQDWTERLSGTLAARMLAAGSVRTQRQVIADADQYGRTHQRADPKPNQPPCATARTCPFAQGKTPQCREQNVAGHVQGARGKRIASHLALAHRVEEELEVPQGAAKCGQQGVAQQGRRRGTGGRSADPLPGRTIPFDENGPPNQIRGQAAAQHDAEHWQSL